MLEKITNRQVVRSINGMGSFKRSGSKGPVKLMYAINKNLEKMLEAIKPFETSKQELLDKYCEVLENGAVIPKKENRKALDSELGELLDIEIEVEVFEIPFALVEDVQMSSEEFDAIEFMIEKE